MYMMVEVIAFGDSLGVDVGDTLDLTAAPGGVRLTRYTPDLARELEVAERIMRENRDALKRLAE